jgi:hypothetical protein
VVEVHTEKGGVGLKITCDVILDLIPLVKDGVASEDSNALVLEHLESCDNCKEEFYDYKAVTTAEELDDKKIITQIKKSLFIIGLALIAIGAFTGIALTNSMGMFYNLILMPLIGAISYKALKRNWYFTPISIFVLSYVWMFVGAVIEGGFIVEALYYPVYISVLYAFLVVLGVGITVLLNFAFRKECKL